MDTNFWEIFKINSTEHKHVCIAASRFEASWKEAKNRPGCDAPQLEKNPYINHIHCLTFRVPYRPVPPLTKHAGTSRSAPRWTHSFSTRFRSIWREFGNKTSLHYYGTLPVSFVYSLLSAPCGTWSEIWFFFYRFVIDLQQLGRTSRMTHSLLYFWMI